MIHEDLLKLKKTIVTVHGQKGMNWWNNLPALLEHLALSQGLTLLTPFKELSFNYVLPVLGPNQESWVLKLSVPHDEFTNEIRALEYYNGVGCAQLIHASSDEGWMILERCTPGTRLVDVKNEQQSILIAVAVMKQLWRPVTEQVHFLSLEKWLQSLKKLTEDSALINLVPKKIRDFVGSRKQELLSSQGERVLLHGDFHHYNILQHHDRWLAIDPKGIIGEREFEIGAFLRNPLCVVEDPQETKEIARNLDLIIELTGFERKKVLSWSLIQALLCVCWYCEDHMLDKAKQLTAYSERLYSLR